MIYCGFTYRVSRPRPSLGRYRSLGSNSDTMTPLIFWHQIDSWIRPQSHITPFMYRTAPKPLLLHHSFNGEVSWLESWAEASWFDRWGEFGEPQHVGRAWKIFDITIVKMGRIGSGASGPVTCTYCTPVQTTSRHCAVLFFKMLHILWQKHKLRRPTFPGLFSI